MNPTDKISEHFTYAEVINSRVANKMQLDNNVPDELLPAIQYLASNLLEPIRKHYNRAIVITSWYRCPALNQMISNNPNSQHTKGEAVDFKVLGIPDIEAATYIQNNLTFDQLILERNWIHCSLINGDNRKDVLRSRDGTLYQKGLK